MRAIGETGGQALGWAGGNREAEKVRQKNHEMIDSFEKETSTGSPKHLPSVKASSSREDELTNEHELLTGDGRKAHHE